MEQLLSSPTEFENCGKMSEERPRLEGFARPFGDTTRIASYLDRLVALLLSQSFLDRHCSILDSSLIVISLVT